ncbi:MAG TPA: DUF6600 domain-containing protein [Chitinivibrionales bacterium]|nr:DUF6600 domain-containing protein [Chitinivibrionales bacterium]
MQSGKILVFLVLSSVLGIAAPAAAQEPGVSVRITFGALNDYGEWIDMPGLGRVWRPDAGPGWRPFMHGHWVYTTEGWFWDADEPFGWIVCHYGYWYDDAAEGWVWVPGYDWSPACVDWFVTDDEIGWVPRFPPGYKRGFKREQWTFCATENFTAADVLGHVEMRLRPRTDQVRGNFYHGAPGISLVQRSVGAPIAIVTPQRVRVMQGPHALYKVQVSSAPRSQGAWPYLGPQFKRPEAHAEQVRPRAENEERPRPEDQAVRPQRSEDGYQPQNQKREHERREER